MNGINLLGRQVSVLKQRNFSAAGTQNYSVFESNVNIVNQSLLKNFNIFCSLFKGKGRGEDEEWKSKTAKKNENKVRSGKESRPNSAKKNLDKTKSITVKPAINVNDLETKMKQAQKFLDKKITVAFKVENPNGVKNALETILSQVQKAVTENKISADVKVTGQVITLHPISEVDKDKESELKNNLQS